VQSPLQETLTLKSTPMLGAQ